MRDMLSDMLGDAPMKAARVHLPWRTPAALAVTQVVHWGSLFYAFAVLAPAIGADLRLTRGTVVGAFSAALLTQGAAALIAGPLIDRLGARRVMTAGSVAAAAALLLAGRVGTLWQLYAAWATIGAVMAFTLYDAAFAAVTAAFGRQAARRGIAAVTLAGGLASTISWPLVGLLTAQEGWRPTLAWLAAANAVCAVLHWLFLPHAVLRGGSASSPASAAPGEADLRSILAQPRFWWLAAALLMVAFLAASMAVHLIALLRGKGLDDATALGVATLLGPMQVAGRLLEVTLGRRASIRGVGMAALLALACALAALALAKSTIMAATAVAAYGASYGTLAIVRGAALAEMFGARAYASIIGIVAAGNAVAAACGPVVVAWLWTASGRDAVPLLAMAAVASAALAAFTVATREPLPRSTASP